EIRTDVLQPAEIQKARQVVATEPKRTEHAPVRARERWLAAPGPPREREEQRQREQHAIHDDRYGIHAVAVRELHDDGLAREGNGARTSQENALERVRGAGSRHVTVGLRARSRTPAQYVT